MNTDINDTICGISTPPGKSGIAVIRISGSRAHEMLKAVFLPVSEDDLTERMLCYGHVKDGMEKIDEAMAVIFSAPHTYTREDMAEL
ncbi:MAG: tRNA uridine-5-carboxymethylaminomethyl(34) synthesis GTPase MnmE, partial [Bacillota bacterium]|nr:tRNA uridine-5-carboxymethylaminomethyl(34) synthesis GTPase MnmE [Bacillota bacterium]